MCEHIEKGAYFKIKKPRWTWEKIGGLEEAKTRLEEMVSLPIKHSKSFEKAGLQSPSGILLWGPPGGGKTALAEAAANSAGSNYISVKAIEIMSEPEEITKMFETAKELAPCIVFINEIDALAPRREATSLWAEGVTRDAPVRLAPPGTTRILFAELDKISERHDIVTIGATYRPDVLDPAILRNGRLDRKIWCAAPDFDERLEILKIHLKKTPLADDVNLEEIAKMTEYYVGADIVGLCREATVIAIKEQGDDFKAVTLKHFKEALKRVPPSLSPESLKKYEEILHEECKHRYMY